MHPLREFRTDRSLSLKDLAGTIGVTEAQISRIELGKRPITADMAIAIERATGGAVPRWRLRPDLWAPPVPSEPAEAGVAA